jgi:hypothetical protein
MDRRVTFDVTPRTFHVTIRIGAPLLMCHSPHGRYESYELHDPTDNFAAKSCLSDHLLGGAGDSLTPRDSATLSAENVRHDSSGKPRSGVTNCMSDDKVLIPEMVRTDIEAAVAEAFDQSDLGLELQRLAPEFPKAPSDQNEVDQIVMWVWSRRSEDWSTIWKESDTFRPYINGFIVAAIQARDLVKGSDPARRVLTDDQRRWLATWERQSGHENR